MEAVGLPSVEQIREQIIDDVGLVARIRRESGSLTEWDSPDDVWSAVRRCETLLRLPEMNMERRAEMRMESRWWAEQSAKLAVRLGREIDFLNDLEARYIDSVGDTSYLRREARGALRRSQKLLMRAAKYIEDRATATVRQSDNTEAA